MPSAINLHKTVTKAKEPVQEGSAGTCPETSPLKLSLGPVLVHHLQHNDLEGSSSFWLLSQGKNGSRMTNPGRGTREQIQW